MTFTTWILFISEWLGVIAIVWALKLFRGFLFKPVDFVYKQREGIVSFSLFGASLLAVLVLTVGRAGQNLIPPPDVPQDVWLRLICGGIALLVFGLSLLIRRQPLLSVGWNRKRLNLGGRLALVLGIMSVFLRGKAFAITNGFTFNEVTMLLVWLGIALAEETIFRGFIQMRLSAWLGSQYGWFLSALMYVIWNIPFIMLTPDIFLTRLIFVVIQSLVLGYLAQKAGHILPVFIYRAISEWLVYAL